MPAPIHYPVWVATGRAPGEPAGTDPLHWGQPCASPSAALREGRLKVEAGEASLAFVVRDDGGHREILYTYVWPVAARRVVLHLIALQVQLK